MRNDFRTYVTQTSTDIMLMERLRKAYPDSIKRVGGIRSRRMYRISKEWVDKYGEILIHEKFYLGEGE